MESLLASVLLIVTGFVVAFFGKRVWNVYWFVVGGLLGAGLAALLAPILLGLLGVGGGICLIILMAAAFIACGVMALMSIKFFLCLAGALALFTLVSPLSFIGGIAAGVIVFVVFLTYFDHQVKVITGVIGGGLASYGLFTMHGSYLLFLVLWAVISIAGIYHQERGEKRREEQKDG